MTPKAMRDHGRAVIETAKDHLVAALSVSPPRGWTAAEWAQAAGVLIDGAAFPAVLVHHVAPVLVAEGRATAVGESDGVVRYGAAAVPSPLRTEEFDASALQAATHAPMVFPEPPPEKKADAPRDPGPPVRTV
jgi:hypothetical protein